MNKDDIVRDEHGDIDECVYRFFCSYCYSSDIGRLTRDNRDNQTVYRCRSCRRTTKYPLFQERRLMRRKKNMIVGDVRRLRSEGVTLAAIGDQFGISRQRVHQLLKCNIL